MRPLVVIGDAMLDRDVDGNVDRLCPDEPAPVFDESGSDDRPGGAALAATLAARSARPVQLVACVGKDEAGQRLRQLLHDSGVELVELSDAETTPEKIRLRTGARTVLRLDRNCAPNPVGQPSPRAQQALANAAAVLVSDYGRGVTSVNAIRRMVATAAASRPVVWDPHVRGGSPVPRLRLIVPNQKELPGGTGEADIASLTQRAFGARHQWRAAAVAVTLGAKGALLVDGGGVPLVIRAPITTDGDACGAGDRFSAAAATALADGAVTSEAVQSAVEAATAFVATGAASGYSRPRRPERRAGLGLAAAKQVIAMTRATSGTVVATGGCFDLLHTGHVSTLQAARALGDCLIVCLNSDASVRERKGDSRPVVSQHDRARMLLALECVDAVVIFDEPTPEPLLAKLRPDVWVKGGDYRAEQMPEAGHITAFGGQAVLVPYLEGRSTTKLINTAAERSMT